LRRKIERTEQGYLCRLTRVASICCLQSPNPDWKDDAGVPTLKSSLLTTRQRLLVDYGYALLEAGFATFVDVDCSLVLGVGHYCGWSARTSAFVPLAIVNDKSIPVLCHLKELSRRTAQLRICAQKVRLRLWCFHQALR